MGWIYRYGKNKYKMVIEAMEGSNGQVSEEILTFKRDVKAEKSVKQVDAPRW